MAVVAGRALALLKLPLRAAGKGRLQGSQFRRLTATELPQKGRRHILRLLPKRWRRVALHWGFGRQKATERRRWLRVRAGCLQLAEEPSQQRELCHDQEEARDSRRKAHTLPTKTAEVQSRSSHNGPATLAAQAVQEAAHRRGRSARSGVQARERRRQASRNS